jgi:type IV pilus assembly protein PilW
MIHIAKYPSTLPVTAPQAPACRLAAALKPQQHRGFTLIELLISMTLGLLVLIAVSTIVVNTGQANREQGALARMQENGRYALGRMAADLRLAGSQYCASISSDFSSPQGGSPLRGLRVKTDVQLPWGLPSRATSTSVPTAAGEAWVLSPRFFMQGHECSLGACNPVLNIVGAAAPTPPGTGTAANQRAAGADVLTVRYLGGAGMGLAAAHEEGPTALSLESPLTPTLAANEFAMAADCRNAEVFSAVAGGNLVTPTGNSGGNNGLRAYEQLLDSRVFNFSQSFLTVTYFLRMRANADGGQSISTLVRQQNGQLQAISDGVERLEFLYGVRTNLASGTPQIRFLTADQVQGGAGLTCLRSPRGVATPEPGCLWRQVESIDVSLLMNTVTDAAPTQTQPFSFSAATPPLVDAIPTATLPSGLARGRMFRREFRTRVNVRSFTQ